MHWWDPQAGPSDPKMVVDRLILDRPYRIATVVDNNPVDALSSYNLYYATSEVMGASKLTMRLQMLDGSGNADVVDGILAGVPWIEGSHPVLDEAFRDLKNLVSPNLDSMPNGDRSAKFLGALFTSIGALANAAATIGSGARARDAQQAEQERLQQLAAMQQAENAAKAERQKRMLWGIGIGTAAVVAIIILVIYLRKARAK